MHLQQFKMKVANEVSIISESVWRLSRRLLELLGSSTLLQASARAGFRPLNPAASDTSLLPSPAVSGRLLARTRSWKKYLFWAAFFLRLNLCISHCPSFHAWLDLTRGVTQRTKTKIV